MKKLLMVILLSPSITMAAGPILKHVQPAQREFENVYQDLKSVSFSTGSYIINTSTLQEGSTLNVASGTINNFTGQGYSKLYGGSGVSQVVDIVALDANPWLYRLINNSFGTPHQAFIDNNGIFKLFVGNTLIYQYNASSAVFNAPLLAGGITLQTQTVIVNASTFTTVNAMVATNVTKTVTPVSPNSNFEILFTGSLRCGNTATTGAFLSVFRNTTNLASDHSQGAIDRLTFINNNSSTGDWSIPVSMVVIDTATHTTASITYAVYMRSAGGATVGLDAVGNTMVIKEVVRN